MAVLSPNSTLGSNVIFTTQDDAITSNVFYELPDLGTTAKSGASIFKHANGVIQYGYLAADNVVAYGDEEGYISGGYTSTTTTTDSIQSFPFVNGTVLTNVKNLIAPNVFMMGFNSTTHGYSSGGRRVPSGSTPGGFVSTADVEKFSFADLNPSSSVGGLSQAKFLGAGHSSESYGYASGGRVGPPFVDVLTIDKFPYVSEGSASSIGNTVQASIYQAGHSSSTDGYSSGGNTSPTAIFDTIHRFPFSSSSPSTDVGELVQSRYSASGSSSDTHGYTAGGEYGAPTYSTSIEKFTFSASSTSSNVGDLTQARRFIGGGNSSTTDGYTAGGVAPPDVHVTIIDKYPFSSDTSSATIAAALTSAGASRHSSQNS